ncbi:MAG: tRNA 4-thiouridine(8) synthase ThiI, partial [Candidatus Aenigmarchaeota archaeon]|nr:tRNA 4-thiouridine(8) synthase ThiI [Candidatus Aenigmarchaeota archaeon]
LSRPELDINIEITNRSAYIYSEIYQGLGGLPVGVTGKVIALVSGGIDSPVAAMLAMKRGCKCVLIHFHNYTLYQDSVKKKILQLAEKLAAYNGHTKLIVVPFADMQKEIIKHVPAEYRMLAYRRAMFMIAEQIREKENAKGFVTGDNLAQVASQTLDNLDVIYSVSKKPVIAPLIGYDKKDIIKLAEQIGTYETSILPYNDCCSAFVAEHPVTRSTREELEEFEKNIDFQAFIEKAVTNVEILDF